MKARVGPYALLARAGLSISASAQPPPPGSYQRSCKEIRMQGPTLTAVCSRTHGRAAQLTAPQCGALRRRYLETKTANYNAMAGSPRRR
jgi:hypothetical protein